MPLVYSPAVGPPPPVIIPAEPTPAPPPPDKEYFTWTPAGGPTMILSEASPSGSFLGGLDDGRSVIGLDMPPQEEWDTQLVGGGELANGRRWLARNFTLPVVIASDTLDGDMGLEQHRRALMASFNPARGEGVFMVAYPSGERRYLSAAYSSGLDVAERGRAGYPYHDAWIVSMKARDPFPYGDERVVRFDPPESYEFFAPPGDPENVVYISASSTSGESTVDIDGEVEVWPEWRIRGPVTSATLRNRDSGKTLTITPNLAAGQTLTIRMNPRAPMARKVTRETGVSVWTSVVGTANFPTFWSLLPGSNRVTVLLTGTAPNQSFAELRYRPRYLIA